MIWENGGQHAAVFRILQPEDGAKNRFILCWKRFSQDFRDIPTVPASTVQSAPRSG